MKKTSIYIMLFFAFGLISCSEIRDIDSANTKYTQYEKAEWMIELKTEFANPYDFNEIALDMQIVTPSGKELSLPCFYVSGQSAEPSQWKARFTPREAGEYKAIFKLSQNKELKSQSRLIKFKAEPGSGKGFLSINNFWSFIYDNGAIFRGIGMNIGWESRDEDDSKYFKALHEDKRFNYDYMLTKLQQNGGNFFRTWMIYWNLPVDWKTVQNNSRYDNTTGFYNESGMQRMDQLVELCDSLGIHMMLALESHVGLMGSGWETSSYNIANGGTASTPEEFFSLESARHQYKNKLRLMVARYGYSPSIAAWEFFNEVDNAMYNVSPENRIPPEVVTDWHNEMSTYLKAIDPYGHIVTTSVSHRDIEGMNDLPSIDINQRHIYKNTDAIPSTIQHYTRAHNKQYIIGESGYEWDWSKNFNDFAGEMDADFRRALWLGLFNPTPVLPLSWWWEYFENRGMMTYFNTVQSVNNEMLEAGKGIFKSLQLTGKNAEGLNFAVECGPKIFVYFAYNNQKNITFGIEGIELKDFQLKKVEYTKRVDITNSYNNNNIVIEGLEDEQNDLIFVFEKK